MKNVFSLGAIDVFQGTCNPLTALSLFNTFVLLLVQILDSVHAQQPVLFTSPICIIAVNITRFFVSYNALLWPIMKSSVQFINTEPKT